MSAPIDDETDPAPPAIPSRARVFPWIVDVRGGEGLTLALSALYFFSLLAGYGVLRPVREAMGLSGGADKLAPLFTGTMVAMLLVSPAFAWLIGRVPRRVFVPAVYAISIVCLFAFWLVFQVVPKSHELWVAYPYFVFVSVFNLFVVSVFWGFMADLWELDQAKRLYGLVGVGGTLGAITGPLLTGWLATRIGTVNLLFVSIAFLTLSLVCIRVLMGLHKIDREGERVRAADTVSQERRTERGTGMWVGLRLVWTSPYLRMIAAYLVLYSLVSTFLYIQQGNLVSSTIPDRDQRTRFFSHLDVWANACTAFVQIFLTGWLIKRFGITFALNTQPVVALAGASLFALAFVLGPRMAEAGLTIGNLAPELAVLAVVQVLLKTSNYATARPAREALYTVVDRDMKYKSKSFIDTFVFRASDATGAWAFKGMQEALGMALSSIAIVTIPLTIAWIFVGRALGARQRELAADGAEASIDSNQTSASKSPPTT